MEEKTHRFTVGEIETAKAATRSLIKGSMGQGSEGLTREMKNVTAFLAKTYPDQGTRKAVSGAIVGAFELFKNASPETQKDLLGQLTDYDTKSGLEIVEMMNQISGT